MYSLGVGTLLPITHCRVFIFFSDGTIRDELLGEDQDRTILRPHRFAQREHPLSGGLASSAEQPAQSHNASTSAQAFVTTFRIRAFTE